MKLFQWRGRTSKKEFRKRFIELCHEAAPQLRFVESAQDELDVSIEGLPAVTSAVVSLQRAYEEFLKAPETRDAILARWLEGQRRLIAPQPLAADNLLPLIKNRRWVRDYYAQYEEPPEPGSERDMLYDEINEEFVVAYVELSAGYHFLRISDLEDLNMSREAVRERALANIRAKAPGPQVRLAGGVWMIFHETVPMSSLMLIDEVWSNPSLAHLDPLVIAAPERDSLIAATGSSPDEIWHLAYMAAGLARQEPYPVSPQLMIRNNGRFELLDPLIKDDTHPIPDLTVLDITYKHEGRDCAEIMIASPLDAGPRSTYRLFRKLDGYLGHLGCNGTAKAPVPVDSRKSSIQVRIHQGSDPEMLALVHSLEGYVQQRGAEFGVTETEG